MRKKNDWRYLVVLLILLALAMLGSRTQAESLAAQREQDALARGLQLKTTVSLDWDGAPFADEETGGMLRSVLDGIDLNATYVNTLSAKLIEEARIPMMAQSEEEAIRIAVKAQRGLDKAALKIVKIRNTLELEEIWISDALLPAAAADPRMELVPQG